MTRFLHIISIAASIVCLLGSSAFTQTVVINELMSSNGETVADEDWEYSDWIELYNTSAAPVDLFGWGLSDDPDEPFRWVFPHVSINPGQYLLVWASGNDRKPSDDERANGLLREVYYDIAGGSADDLLNYPDFPDGPDSRNLVTASFEAPTDIADNYGQRMQGFVRAPVTGNYRFWISADNGSRLYLSTDENPDNAVMIAQIPGAAWSDPRQWNRYTEQMSALVPLVAGQYYYISTIMKEDVGGDHLCVRWQLPDGTIEEPIPGSRLFYEKKQLHTNFSLSADGEELTLTMPDGMVADQTAAVELIGDVSYGRTVDGTGTWAFFEQATPRAANSASTPYLGIQPPVQFSQAAGFYTQPFDVSLSTADPGAQIVYTLDGSVPDADNLAGTSYGYKNSYPSGAMLYRTYQSYAYQQPLHVAQNQLPLAGISSINTENNGGTSTPSNWIIDGDQLVQNSLSTNIRLMFGDPTWTDYEFTCQALKDGGNEGFLIFFRADGEHFYLLNYGGWNNAQHGVEKGYDGGGWSLFVNKVSGSVNTNQWYNVRVRCEGNRFRCWLDSTLVFDFTDNSGSSYLTGGVGLGTWSTQSRYRNIEVKSLTGAALFSGLPGRQSDATVVRARSYRPGYIPSVPASMSYFVSSDLSKRHTIPVVSMAVEEPDFFGYEQGIYVAGANYNNTGNFWMRGDAWERPVDVSLFEPDGTLGFSQLVGARIHGGWTRNLPQKALRLYARGDYGRTEINYPVFPGVDTDIFKRLLLRNSGNDWGQTLFRDAMMQKLVEHLPIDTQSYRPAVLYINGEYWGINNLRQRFDKYYLYYKYGVDPEKLDILEYLPNAQHSVKEGTSTHYDETLAYIESNGLSDPNDYAWVQTRIDTDNFINYQVSQIYFNNTDWPGNNNDWWRLQTDAYNPTAPYGHDGRWRWMLYDTDFGFGLSGWADSDTLSFAMSTSGTGWPNPHWTTYLFRKLLENQTFRNDFINRYADLLNTAFLPDRVIGVIDEMKAGIAPEINRHIARWGSPGSYGGWEGSVNTMRSFAQQRPAYARTHLRSKFSLGADQMLTLNVSNSLQGHVRVNATDINANTPGVNPAAVYPWSGTYFQGVPITVTAVPQPGYLFTHWQAGDGATYTDATLTLSLTAAMSLTAYFEEAPDPMLLHYWSFNNGTTLQTPTFSIGQAQMTVAPAEQTALLADSGQNFAGVNNRLSELTGTHLRINYPLGAAVTISAPTTNYENIVLQYETRRSGSGAGQQVVSYSINGSTFVPLATINVPDGDPVLQRFDLSAIAGTDNNPLLKIRIELAQGTGGTSGNNRFDNLTIDGVPMEGTNPPPQIIGAVGLREMVEQTQAQIDLAPYFMDSDPLTYAAGIDKPSVASVSVSGSVLTVNVISRGGATVQVTALDGANPPVTASFRVLVYPAPQPLRLGLVRLANWPADMPENAFPAGFLFLQSDVSDPGLDQALEYPYFVPHEDYAVGDQGLIGFPYSLTSRTRLNGLGIDGVSFINTGRARDLGGALTAIDTRGMEGVRVSWLGGTILRNSRLNAIRLQYRIGHTGPFTDVLSNGLPVEYQAQSDGHVEIMGPVELPAETVDQPYVQLLWRYYYVEGTGSRPQLRLDDIAISGVLDLLADPALFAQWWLKTGCAASNNCGGADLTRDGRVNLDDFAIFAGQWMNENMP